MYTHSQNETDPNSHTRLEIVFPLDGDASKFVPNIPTYIMNIYMLNVSNMCQHYLAKVLTIANQSEIPDKQNLSAICSSY